MSIHSTLRLSFAFGALALLPVVLSACDTMDDNDSTSLENQIPQTVQQAPPHPEFEAVPFITDPQAEIWRPGHWALEGNQFVWVSGRVIPRPSPTAVWQPARWVHHAYGWSFQQGHWE
jgi:hypothetical protein